MDEFDDFLNELNAELLASDATSDAGRLMSPKTRFPAGMITSSSRKRSPVFSVLYELLCMMAHGAIKVDLGVIDGKRDGFKKRVRAAARRTHPEVYWPHIDIAVEFVSSMLNADILSLRLFEQQHTADWHQMFRAIATQSWISAIDILQKAQTEHHVFLHLNEQARLASKIAETVAHHQIQLHSPMQVSSRFQAAVHMLSFDDWHRASGAVWFAKHSRYRRSSHWWSKNYPGLEVINAGMALNGTASPFLRSAL